MSTEVWFYLERKKIHENLRGVTFNVTETALWRIQEEIYLLTAVARLGSLPACDI